MSLPFVTASKISALYSRLSVEKRKEFRQRILGSDDIRPVLMEIDMAAHFWQMGFDLDWVESAVEGERIADFRCKRKDLFYEVECKSKTVDAGRMVARGRFYRLVDLLVEQLRSKCLHGQVQIVPRGTLSGHPDWQMAVVEKVADLPLGQSTNVVLDDGTSITASLNSGEKSVPKQELDAILASERKRSGYVDFAYTDRSPSAFLNPLVIAVRSRKPDTFRKSVLKDLKDARKQLSGNQTGIIMCFVPELEHIDRIPRDSELGRLSKAFFENHPPDSIFGITFVSDEVSEVGRDTVETLSPSRTFYNPRYNSVWGSAERYMAGSI